MSRRLLRAPAAALTTLALLTAATHDTRVGEIERHDPTAPAGRGDTRVPLGRAIEPCPTYLRITEAPSDTLDPLPTPTSVTTRIVAEYGVVQSSKAPLCLQPDFDEMQFSAEIGQGHADVSSYFTHVRNSGRPGAYYVATAAALPVPVGTSTISVRFLTKAANGSDTTLVDSRDVIVAARPKYAVKVTDDPANATALGGLAEGSFAFTVENTGRARSGFAITCGVTGPLLCTGVTPQSVNLDPGQQTRVEARGVATAAGTPGLRVAARGPTNVTVTNPAADSATHGLTTSAPHPLSIAMTNGARQDRAVCPTMGTGGPAAVQCGDLLYAHAFPAYRTRNKARGVTLLYNSATASATPVVVADYITLANVQADAFRVRVDRTDTPAQLADLAFDAAGADASERRVRRFVVPVSAASSGLATGAYPVRVTVEHRAGGQLVATDTASTYLLVVDRRSSQFGAGWWPAGVERLHMQQDGAALLVEADGSATRFAPSGNAFVSPPGEYSRLERTTQGFTRTLPGNRVRVLYDATGLVRSVRDTNPTPNAATYSWIAGGPDGYALDAITDATGKVVRFSRDPQGRVNGITIPGVNPISLTQSAQPSGFAVLESIVDPDGVATHFGYDAATGRMTSSQPRALGAFTFAYDAVGRVASSVPPAVTSGTAAVTRQFRAWQLAGAPTPAAPGSSAAPAHAALADSAWARMSWPRPGGSGADEVHFQIGPQWSPIFVFAPGKLPLGIERDSAGQPVRIRNRAGVDVRQVWDARGNLTSVSQRVMGTGWTDRNTWHVDVTQYEYDPRWDAVTKVTSPSGRSVTRFSYDDYGRRATATDARSNVTTFTHTADGLPSTITEAGEANPTVYGYDPQTRNLTTVSKGARTTTYFYDAANGSDVRKVVDPALTPTEYTYDAMKRVLTTTVGGGSNLAYTVTTAYDDAARQRTQTDPLGRTTTWTSDEAGRVIRECRPSGDCIRTSYADGMNPTGVARDGAAPVTTTFGPDGRVLTQANRDETIKFGYDEDGRQTRVLSRHSIIHRLFDAYGRLTCERQTLQFYTSAPSADSTKFQGITVWHDYDVDGHRVTTYVGTDASYTTADPDAADGSAGGKLCDGGFQPQGLRDLEEPLDPSNWQDPLPYAEGANSWVPAANAIRYAYDQAGNLTSIDNDVWAKETGGAGLWTYEYDAKNRASRLYAPLPGGDFGSWTYDGNDDLSAYHAPGLAWAADPIVHDAAGRTIQVQGSGNGRTYTYDDVGRLKTEQQGNGATLTYSYDRAGNRLSDGADSYTYGDGTTGGQHNVGRLLSREGITNGALVVYDYDARGNETWTGSSAGLTGNTLTADGDRASEYDASEHLSRVRTRVKAKPSTSRCASGTLVDEDRVFWYDGLGRRILMKSLDPCALDRGTWRYFWLDNHVAVKTFNVDPRTNAPAGTADAPNATWPSLQSGTRATGQWIFYGPGTDNALGAYNGTQGGAPEFNYVPGTHFVYLADERGSVVETRCLEQTAVTRCAPLGAGGYSGFGSPASGASQGGPGYNGAEASGGLVYMRNRWYDPNTGRFTQEDPIGFAGGINLYAYTGNDPVNYSDPFGLLPDLGAFVDGVRNWLYHSEGGQLLTAVACSFGCEGRTEEAQQAINAAEAKYPVLALATGERTPPNLPQRVLAKVGEVEVQHFYRSGDHGPAHAHVTGGGPETRIGPKGHPLSGDPALTPAQQRVTDQYAKEIRKELNRIGRWLQQQ